MRVGSLETDCSFSQGGLQRIYAPFPMAASGKRGDENVQCKRVMEYGPQEVEP